MEDKETQKRTGGEESLPVEGKVFGDRKVSVQSITDIVRENSDLWQDFIKGVMPIFEDKEAQNDKDTLYFYFDVMCTIAEDHAEKELTKKLEGLLEKSDEELYLMLYNAHRRAEENLKGCNKDLAKEIGTLRLEKEQLEDSLRQLVNLKEYKDKNGKDAHYNNLKPIAWMIAKKLIKE